MVKATDLSGEHTNPNPAQDTPVSALAQSTTQVQVAPQPSAPVPSSAPPAAPSESTSRKAFITTLVSILLSPLSVALGFYLNHILQKPDLRIDTVDQTFVVESHAIPRDVVKAIASTPILSAQLRESITRLEQSSPPQCVDWLDGETWDDDCFAVVSTAAQGLMNSVSAAGASRVPRWLIDAAPSKTELSAAATALNTLITWLSSASNSDDTPRTGDMCFDANVVNSGDFDGVITRKGHLRFDGKDVTLFSDKYTIVKAHGYEKITYCTKNALDADSVKREDWRKIVKSGKNATYSITIIPSERRPLEHQTSLE